MNPINNTDADDGVELQGLEADASNFEAKHGRKATTEELMAQVDALRKDPWAGNGLHPAAQLQREVACGPVETLAPSPLLVGQFVGHWFREDKAFQRALADAKRSVGEFRTALTPILKLSHPEMEEARILAKIEQSATVEEAEKFRSELCKVTGSAAVASKRAAQPMYWRAWEKHGSTLLAMLNAAERNLAVTLATVAEEETAFFAKFGLPRSRTAATQIVANAQEHVRQFVAAVKQDFQRGPTFTPGDHVHAIEYFDKSVVS
jgi:hypothetical protein